jgi:anti-repressor protein
MAAVRTVEQDVQVWFVARCVCDILGISDVSTAMYRLVDDEKLTRVLPVSGQNRNVTVISESGLYSLIMRSNKAEAKPFRKWVTSVVLSTIRKTGGYVTQDTLNDPEKLREMLLAQIEMVIEYQPKVTYLEHS